MERLNKDWITENHLDFEYKKYVLLAYLQHVNENFKTIKLYPALSDLIDHYKTTLSIKENKNQLAAHFPQRLKGFAKGIFQFESDIRDNEKMIELESILDFSLEKFAVVLHEGKQIYDFLEQEIQLHPIGIIPLRSETGYLFLKDRTAHTQVFYYTITLFEHSDASFRAIHTQYVRTYTNSIMHSYDAIKSELISSNKSLPNPAVFAAETPLTIPVQESFLPIAKRMLAKEISK